MSGALIGYEGGSSMRRWYSPVQSETPLIRIYLLHIRSRGRLALCSAIRKCPSGCEGSGWERPSRGSLLTGTPQNHLLVDQPAHWPLA
jgi:hypothetical protein